MKLTENNNTLDQQVCDIKVIRYRSHERQEKHQIKMWSTGWRITRDKALLEIFNRTYPPTEKYPIVIVYMR